MTGAQLRTAGLHAGSVIAGATATVMWMSQKQVDIYALVDQLNDIVKAVATLIASVSTLLAGAYGVFKATTQQKMVDVVKDPSTPPEVAAAVQAALPPAAKVVVFLAVMIAGMMAFGTPSFAQGALKGIAQKNDLNRPGGITMSAPAAPSSIGGLLEQFDRVQIADLNVALAYARSEDDRAAVQCYTAWLEQVQRLAKVREENPGTDGPQIITAFQKARNLMKRLDTDSPLRMACAALAADAKQDVRQFIGSVISGTALKALIPIP